MLEKIFKLKEHGTDVKTEVIAGITTFLAMAYILAVNPNILGTVMNANGVFLATAITSAIATFIMAFLANYPIVLSAGMGLNAYFAYTVCLGELSDVPDAFTIALTAVLVEGIFFIFISVFKFREAIINGIPQNLKFGITTGIGLFIALIGLVGAGIVVSDPSTTVALGDFKTPQVALALIGFIVIVVLSHFKVKGAILLGILVTWILGMIAEATGWYQVDVEAGVFSVFPNFSSLFNFNGGLGETAFKFNFGWVGSHITQFIAIVFSFLFVDLFDTVGTVVGVADKAGLLDEEGKLPRAGKVFMADAIGTTVGACLGTSTVTSFVESTAGVAEGGRTGLTALVSGILFLVSIVFSPIFLAIPSFATAPALVYVGMLMFASATKIKFDGDVADTASAYMAALMMPLTYSIANGIMFGIISWVIIKVCTGKAKDVTPVMWVVFVLFALRIIALVTNFQ
ncbi:MAG: NCS2 family permease [Eubacterium sp.]|nr:NCS2 family permease [Eubacterium sp.]